MRQPYWVGILWYKAGHVNILSRTAPARGRFRHARCTRKCLDGCCLLFLAQKLGLQSCSGRGLASRRRALSGAMGAREPLVIRNLVKPSLVLG